MSDTIEDLIARLRSRATCSEEIEAADALTTQRATIARIDGLLHEANVERLELKQRIAALERAAAEQREGWQWVPKEPTEAMKIAGDNAGWWCADKYSAMLAAAPTSKQGGE